MKIVLEKDLFLQKLSIASKFTSQKLSSEGYLQGVYAKVENQKLNLYSTNLNTYYHTTLSIKEKIKDRFIFEPRRIIEFISLLPPGNITIDKKESVIKISKDKIHATFPLFAISEFPTPPKLKEKKEDLKTDFLKKYLPKVFFAASTDDARPTLTGINILSQDGQLLMVATDGFRLSLQKLKTSTRLPSMLVPRDFLEEVVRYVKDEESVDFIFSQTEKLVLFKSGNDEFYTRLISGEFPPFEKVIPSEYKTKAVLEREEFLRNIKLMSVNARDFSSIVILEFKKNTIVVKPKTDVKEENFAIQEDDVSGEEQAIAFNYKFIIDFLNHTQAKKIIIEVLRPDAPAVFKEGGDNNFLHIIMPVRIQT